jgi:serine/threonine-protein kinase RsbW
VSSETPQLHLVLPAAPENVVVARQAITGLCEGLGFPSRATDDVRLAVTEACTNVVVHAYGPDVAAAQLELEATAVDQDLLVTIRDRGRGMGVFTGAAGLGLGLPLIAALTRAVEMRTGPGGVGTEIAMTFSKDEAADQDVNA